MNEREFITIGALLHDIGKVVQRASDNPKAKTHQEFGSEWLKNTQYHEFSDFALYHHFKPKYHPELDVYSQNRNDLLLVAHADNLSSGEREKGEYGEKAFDIMRPLKSIFSSVAISNKDVQPHYYRPRLLNKGIFYPSKNIDRLTPDDYREILESFNSKLLDKTVHPDPLLDLLEEYFTLIPSHTAEVEGISTDVSLFDHLKTTAAIALAAYNYFVDTLDSMQFSEISADDITDTKTNRYMFIGVDISGIQDFIYMISSKGALKLLRARSFYVEMLLEFLAMKLLNELKLYHTNLLFLGGGNFIMLAQNTEESRKLVDRVMHDFNERLFTEHNGKLWLSHAIVEFCGETFYGKERNVTDVLDELHLKIQISKTHKFVTFYNLDFIFEPGEAKGNKECDVCGVATGVKTRRIGDEEVSLCPVCSNLYDVGETIHKTKYVIYNPKDSGAASLAKLSIYRGEELYLYKGNPPDGEFVWIVNPTGEEPHDYGVRLYLGNYPEKGRNFDPEVNEKEKKKAPPFNYLGAKLVGTLKMDVDNLGYIFSRGIPEKKRSISRLATLSRFFNLFFRRFINDIARGELGRENQFSIVHPGQAAPREAVVVYAGGDDLFIVGAWHDVIELAFDIRKAFKEFVGGDHITISGGVAINHIKHPIHLFAENAGEAENKSKSYGGNEKDAFTLFDHTMRWEDWERIVEKEFLRPVRESFYGNVKVTVNEDAGILWGSRIDPSYLPSGGEMGELKRSVVYKLMWISNELKEHGLKLKPLALLTYLIARNKVLKNAELFDEWRDIRKSYKILRNLKPALMWLDLMVRRQEKEGG